MVGYFFNRLKYRVELPRFGLLPDALPGSRLDPVDAVADTVDGRTAELLLEKVKPGGVFASVLGPPANEAAYPKVNVKAMQVTADAKMLVHMAEAIRDGKLSIPVGEKFPLSVANKAHAEAENGRGGKIPLLA